MIIVHHGHNMIMIIDHQMLMSVNQHFSGQNSTIACLGIKRDSLLFLICLSFVKTSTYNISILKFVSY